VVVRQARDRTTVLRVLRRRFRYLGLDHGVASFAGRRKLGITILDRASATRLLRRLYRSPEDFLESQGVVQHKIVEAIAIYDPGGLLPRYQALADAYPQPVRRAVFRGAIRSLEATYEEWGWRNEFHYASDLPSILDSVCLALYARNRRLFMTAFKRLPKDLKELTPNLEAQVYRLARGGRSERSRRAARGVLKQILRKTRQGWDRAARPRTPTGFRALREARGPSPSVPKG